MNSKIDIDLIKDEQNPMYQNVDIQRQRLISVLNRALEKICIAYVLEEMLTKNLSLVQNYITQGELDSIIKFFRYARCLEKGPTSIKDTVMRRSTLFKAGHLSSKSINISGPQQNKSKKSTTNSVISRPSNLTISPSLQFEVDTTQDQDKGSSPYSQLIRGYYNSVIAKLHFNPDVTNLAKYMIRKRPVGTIKYYVYLKDLRDHVIKVVYETKTDELNYTKNIKRAYVKNLKEKPQAEAIKKLLQTRQNEKEQLEQKIKKNIEKEKIIQTKMNEELICDSYALINKSEQNIIARTEQHHEIQEDNKIKFAEHTACYNKKLDENLAAILVLRRRVRKLEVCYRKILDDYDNTMGALQGDFEIINDGYLKVEAKYNELRHKFDIQEEEYDELMAEKAHYIEMTCLRIRYNRSAKIVQHWWREILCKRWKWRKTYLATQLNRKSLAPAQRAKMKKILKKIHAKQKKMLAKKK